MSTFAAISLGFSFGCAFMMLVVFIEYNLSKYYTKEALKELKRKK